MNAGPLLHQIAEALAKSRLEAVLIGNAAAALHGAPVTTLDFDFMFRRTPANLAKLKKFAVVLEAQILRPYYPVSGLFRVVNEDRGLQADFLSTIHGLRSFAGLRSRAQRVEFGGDGIWVAALRDIIASKRAARRPRDRAVLEVLEETLHAQETQAQAKKTGA
jgi:hypothetical protein